MSQAISSSDRRSLILAHSRTPDSSSRRMIRQRSDDWVTRPTESPKELLILAEREVALGSIYAALDRLEEKRFVTSLLGEVYRLGQGKSYQFVARSGSAMLQTRVFDRLLKEEAEMSHGEARQRASVNSQNYVIRVAGEEDRAGRRCYVLELTHE
jgi:DNA-binding PadR family transcriptional regulator